jgi:hypothetical protein
VGLVPLLGGSATIREGYTRTPRAVRSTYSKPKWFANTLPRTEKSFCVSRKAGFFHALEKDGKGHAVGAVRENGHHHDTAHENSRVRTRALSGPICQRRGAEKPATDSAVHAPAPRMATHVVCDPTATVQPPGSGLRTPATRLKNEPAS